MKKLLIALAASVVASAASAQVVTAPVATGKPAAAAPQAAPADAGTAAKQQDTTKSVTKQRKKAKKSTVKLGTKTSAVQ